LTSDASFPDVGHRLAAARLRRKLSQATVARRAGIDASYLSRIENGKVQPTLHTIVRVVRGLRGSIDEVVSPDPVELQSHGACPISQDGLCLLELIRPETGQVARQSAEHYTARDIRLLRRVAAWLRSAGPERVHAMELLIEDLSRALPEEPATARTVPPKADH